ncbi:MAG: hypothetical protein KC496_19420 [Anaerolineae bacterium]|nr:hypothetical protein [Anaerolineae bacterium]
MLRFLRREGDTSNTVFGVILLVMLLVFVGPDVLPRLVSRTFSFVDEGVPCTRLRTASDRGLHQSLIGRSSRDAISMDVQANPLPNDGSPWIVRIIIVNDTIGTVPIVFSENQILTVDDGNSGVGLIFNPPVNINLGTIRPPAASTFSNDNIRLLGPRQRCVHRVEIPAAQLSGIIGGQTTVRSYYRITTPGAVLTTATAIFPDQGLAILSDGIETSDTVVIPASVSAEAQAAQ